MLTFFKLVTCFDFDFLNVLEVLGYFCLFCNFVIIKLIKPLLFVGFSCYILY